MRIAKKSKTWIVLLTVFSVLGVFGMICGAGASNNFPGIYNSYFGTTPNCSLCHSSIPALNSTGTTFSNAGGNTTAGWAAIKPADPTPPTMTITTPTSSPTYTASSSSLSIGGTASDNFTGPFGVTQVTWANSLGGAGTCSGTTSWSASGISLSSGQNVITVTARDQAGNTGTDTLTVAYTPAPAPVLTTITVTPPSASIPQGSTQQFSAQAFDQNNNPISATFSWSSSSTAVATINSSSGLATGVAPGSTTITATSEGISGTASLTVTAPAPPPPTPVLTSITVAPATASIVVGSTQLFTATARDQNNNPISATFSWSSSSTAVATINSSSGLAAGVAAGSATITAASGTISGTASLTVRVASPEPPPPIPGTADLSIWVDKWFKVKIQNKGYYNEEENRLSDHRQGLSAFLKVTAWDPDNKVLQATILGKGEEGKWSEPILLHYISGTNLKFLCWSQMTLAGDANFGFTAQIRGSKRRGELAGGTFTSVGGYHVETTEGDDDDDDEDADGEESSKKQPPAGWLKITGKLIAGEKVPADIKE